MLFLSAVLHTSPMCGGPFYISLFQKGNSTLFEKSPKCSVGLFCKRARCVEGPLATPTCIGNRGMCRGSPSHVYIRMCTGPFSDV